MTKRIIAILFAVVLIFSAALIPAGAAGAYGVKLDDAADLLNSEEESMLTAKMQEVSDTCQCNVLFLTANDQSGATFTFNGTGEDYCKRYYETTFGVNVDGVIVYLTLHDEDGDRQLYVYGTGKMEKRLSNSESEDIRTDAINHHKPETKGYYDFFLSICDGLEKAIPPHMAWYKLPLAFLIGFGIALLILLILKGQLKSVKMERGAVNYVRPGSMNVTASRDTYLYRTVSRTARPKNNSSSSGSSGGGSYSGGGSKF